MAGMTPRYGIRFPDLGDVVTDQSIADTMNDIDAVLAAVAARVDAYLHRPFCHVNMFGVQNVPSGADTLLVLSITSDPSGMLTSSTAITLPSSGLWYVNARGLDVLSTGGQVPTGTRFRMRHNGTARIGKSSYAFLGNTADMSFSGLFPAAAGDQIQFDCRWAGAGGAMTAINGQATVTKIGEI